MQHWIVHWFPQKYLLSSSTINEVYWSIVWYNHNTELTLSDLSQWTVRITLYRTKLFFLQQSWIFALKVRLGFEDELIGLRFPCSIYSRVWQKIQILSPVRSLCCTRLIALHFGEFTQAAGINEITTRTFFYNTGIPLTPVFFCLS